MKPLDDKSREMTLALLAQIEDMSLTTVRPDGYPQATIVSFASDGLTLYVGIGLDSQKAHNVRLNDKVSLTLYKPQPDWQQTKSLSLSGRAAIIADAEEMARAAACLLHRFPNLPKLQDTSGLPWAGALFLRITPEVISLLDYTKGFGHSETYTV